MWHAGRARIRKEVYRMTKCVEQMSRVVRGSPIVWNSNAHPPRRVGSTAEAGAKLLQA